MAKATKKRCRTFAKLLAQELDFKKPKKLKKYFRKAVLKLDNPLKAELLQNEAEYISICLESIDKKKEKTDQLLNALENGNSNGNSTTKKRGKDIPTTRSYPFNLHHKKKKHIKTLLKKIEKKEVSLSDSECRCLLAGTGATKEVTSVLLKDMVQGPASWLDEVRVFVTVMIGQTQPEILQRAMSLLLSGLDTHLKEVLNAKRKKLQAQLRTIEELITYIHLKSQHCKSFSNPSYNDLMAAILSFYVEIVLRSDEEETKTKLPVFVCTLLKDHHSMDVLLQMTDVDQLDTWHLLPLWTRILGKSSPEALKAPDVYIKYMCAVRMLTKLSADMKFKGMALSVSAPKGFTDWLLELDGDILNETPLTSKSRGIDVTRFLLEEATEQDIEAFLNVLTVGCKQESTETSAGEKDAAESLFVIDKSSDAHLASDLEELRPNPMFTIDITPDEMVGGEVGDIFLDKGPAKKLNVNSKQIGYEVGEDGKMIEVDDEGGVEQDKMATVSDDNGKLSDEDDRGSEEEDGDSEEEDGDSEEEDEGSEVSVEKEEMGKVREEEGEDEEKVRQLKIEKEPRGSRGRDKEGDDIEVSEVDEVSEEEEEVREVRVEKKEIGKVREDEGKVTEDKDDVSEEKEVVREVRVHIKDIGKVMEKEGKVIEVSDEEDEGQVIELSENEDAGSDEEDDGKVIELSENEDEASDEEDDGKVIELSENEDEASDEEDDGKVIELSENEDAGSDEEDDDKVIELSENEDEASDEEDDDKVIELSEKEDAASDEEDEGQVIEGSEEEVCIMKENKEEEEKSKVGVKRGEVELTEVGEERSPKKLASKILTPQRGSPRKHLSHGQSPKDSPAKRLRLHSPAATPPRAAHEKLGRVAQLVFEEVLPVRRSRRLSASSTLSNDPQEGGVLLGSPHATKTHSRASHQSPKRHRICLIDDDIDVPIETMKMPTTAIQSSPKQGRPPGTPKTTADSPYSLRGKSAELAPCDDSQREVSSTTKMRTPRGKTKTPVVQSPERREVSSGSSPHSTRRQSENEVLASPARRIRTSSADTLSVPKMPSASPKIRVTEGGEERSPKKTRPTEKMNKAKVEEGSKEGDSVERVEPLTSPKKLASKILTPQRGSPRKHLSHGQSPKDSPAKRLRLHSPAATPPRAAHEKLGRVAQLVFEEVLPVRRSRRLSASSTLSNEPQEGGVLLGSPHATKTHSRASHQSPKGHRICLIDDDSDVPIETMKMPTTAIQSSPKQGRPPGTPKTTADSPYSLRGKSAELAPCDDSQREVSSTTKMRTPRGKTRLP